MDPAIVAFGLGVGVLVGMTGIGGGSLMTPLLILVFGIKPITAVGTDLAYGAVTKTVGGCQALAPEDRRLVPVHVDGGRLGAGGHRRRLRARALERAHGEDFDDLLILLLAITLLFCGVMTLARALFLKRHARHGARPVGDGRRGQGARGGAGSVRGLRARASRRPAAAR